MTFSEYVATLAMKDYLRYCRQNGIKPEVDIKLPKLCALVLPSKNESTNQTRANSVSSTTKNYA